MMVQKGNLVIRRRVMRSVAAFFGVCGLGASIPSADAGGLNAVQYFYVAEFASGSQSTINQPITPTTPKGQTLVVQTISVYRFPSQSSTLQTFIAVPYGTQTGYFSPAGYCRRKH